MSSVIKKKRKTLLENILGKIKPNLSSIEKRDIKCNIPLNDARIDDVEIAIITSRRNELRNVKHGNSDAIVVFGNKQNINY